MSKYFGLVAAAVYLLVFMVPITIRPLAIADESRYAEIPREMIESGEWVVPQLNGLRYFEKPPLGYWLVALSMKALGQNTFAVRLPAALSAGLTALLIFWLIRRQTQDTSWAQFSILIYLTSILVFIVGGTIVLDGIFTLFLTAAIAFFFAFDQESNSTRQNVFLVLFGLSCGLAFLTKGLLAFVVPAAVIGPYLVWSRNWRGLFQFPLMPVVVAFLVILPWAIAIHFKEADFWRYFVWEEHIRRFTGEDAQHAEPAWYFLHILGLGLLPWTFLVPAAAVGWRRKQFSQPLMRYAVCWFAMPFLFFSASTGKLGTYILPCFAPLAILLARGLLDYVARERHPVFTWGAMLQVFALIAGILVIVARQFIEGFHDPIYADYEMVDLVLLIIGMLAWAALLIASIRTTVPTRKLVLFTVAPILLYTTFSLALPYQLKAGRTATYFLQEHAHRFSADSIVVADEKRTHTLCWFLKRSDVIIYGHGEFRYGLTYPDAAGRNVDLAGLIEGVKDKRRTRPIIFFTDRGRWNRDAHLLPEPSFLAIDDPPGDTMALVIAQFD